MKKVSPILSGHFDNLFWIKPDGKGTFQESEALKKVAEKSISETGKRLVVDLESCPRMDSTFMGMLAGIAMKLKRSGGQPLSIVGTSEKTKDSLEELGLAQLMEIEPEEPEWAGRLSEIRNSLSAPVEKEAIKPGEDLILKCHENLCEADEENLTRFKTVLEMMGSDKVDSSKS